VLSTVAVAGINIIEIKQEGAFKIYVPLFITIYILSRWIDGKFTQPESIDAMNDKKQNPSSEKGFAMTRKQ
jgi:hypothetical protein